VDNEQTTDVSALHARNLHHLSGYYTRFNRDFGTEERNRLKGMCEELSAAKMENSTDFRNDVAQKIKALIDLV
jgi:hypothetical protein